MYRQRLTGYRIVRSFVLGVYLLILMLMTADLARVTVGTVSYIPAYSALSIVLGLAQGVLLLTAAQGVYFGPGATLGTYGKELRRRRGHEALFSFFVALVVVVIVYSTLINPAAVGYVTDFAGNTVPSTRVGMNLIALILGLLAFFLAYPVALLLRGASKVQEEKLRASIGFLGVGWGAVSGLYILTEVYMWTYGVDYLGPLYLANAIIFYLIIRNFRRSAALSGFVEHHPPAYQEAPGAPTPGMSEAAESIAGKKVLYEVDPAVPYESNLRATLEDLAWGGHAIYVFTPKASPLHGALTGGTSLKFFLKTSTVSYMKVSEDTNEVLVPQSDTAILLDVADKTLSSNKGKVVFVFDSVSELLLMAGIEKTYKFLKQFLEVLSDPRVTGLFVFIKRAHDSKDENLLRGIFPSHYVVDSEGARLVK